MDFQYYLQAQAQRELEEAQFNVQQLPIHL